MKKQLGMILFATGMVIGVSYIGFNKLHSDQTKKSIAQHNLKITTVNAKMKLRKHSKVKEGELAKSDEPDKFAEFYKAIRTREGETEPGYKLNYKFEELKKARANRSANRSILPWVQRGPANVGGRTRGLIVDPDDPTFNTWFAGSVGGGIWKTTNAGASWVNLTPELPNLATTVLAMAESNHDVIYAGTGEGFFNVDAVAGDGIWKSTTRGNSWTQLPSTAGNNNFKYINRILVDPADENVVIALTNSGIYRSTTGGDSWGQVFNIGTRIQHIIANPQNFNILYAAANGVGILKSIDAGQNWQPIETLSNAGRIELAIAPTDTARIYASVESSSSQLYMSTNSGTSWDLISEQNVSGPNWLGSQGWYDNTIAVNPYDEDIVFVGGINIYKMQILPDNKRVTTQLTNWYPGAGFPFVHADHHNLVMVPTNPSNGIFRIVNANDGGVEYSDDGGVHWAKTLNSYITTQFYGVDKKPGSSEYIGGTQDNGTWQSIANPDSSTPWIEQLGGDGFDVAWNYSDPNKIIGSVYNNSFYRSLDGGNTWEDATQGLDDVGSGGPFITTIGKSQSDPELLFAVGSHGVWRSDNFAQDWTLTPISTNWSYSSLSGQVKISRANPQIVWAGFYLSTNGKVFVSTDGGINFNSTNNYAVTNLGLISGMDTHPLEDSTAFLIFSMANAPKILRTTDLGQTWQDISGFGSNSTSNNGFPNVATYCVLVMPHTPNTLWAGTEIGLFESTDNGASWHYANNGFPAVSIWDMKVVDDQIVVATHGRGIWSVTIPELLNVPPPAVTLSPRLNPLAQAPDGFLNIDINLRSVYDSTVVSINQQKLSTIFNNAPADTLIKYPVTQAGTISASLTSYKDGDTYLSAIRSASVVPFAPPQITYSNDFNNLSNDFIGNGFVTINYPGFSNPAIHSIHPYSNYSSYIYRLIVPIIVASTNATVQFDEVVLVEAGDPGSEYGDPDFFDYVIVEGSRDGIKWLPIEDGYDSRYDSDWLNAYNSGLPGDSTLLKTHTMNLLNTFSPGEQILLRFRLFSDAAVNSWGWTLDNLKLQEGVTGIAENEVIPGQFALFQNYPNPFNPSTTIQYQLARSSRVELKIYSTLGQLVRTLVENNQQAGLKTVVWDGKDRFGNAVASGVYLYRIKAGDFIQSKKMILLK